MLPYSAPVDTVIIWGRGGGRGSFHTMEEIFFSQKTPGNTPHISLAQSGSYTHPPARLTAGEHVWEMLSADWLEHISALSWN